MRLTLPKVKLTKGTSAKVNVAKTKVSKAEAVRKGAGGRKVAIDKAKQNLKKMEARNSSAEVIEKVVNDVIKKVVKTKIKEEIK